MNVLKKLEPLHPSLVFAGRPESTRVKLLSGLHSRVGSWPYRKHYTRMERFDWDSHSRLLRTFVDYGRKKFYNIGPV